jgi:peroxiredoxin
VTSSTSYDLPPDLPVPVDDGACQGITGRRIPSVPLSTTSGKRVDLSTLHGTVVLFCYPHTGRPNISDPIGWDEIPGARGCTPQACAFRDHFSELRDLDVTLFGLSADPPEWQQEAVRRLRLPFELLSDSEFAFTRAIGLPTFQFNDRTFIKRVTLVIRQRWIRKVFYPIFPPNRNASDVIAFLRV